jgi:hypothetical protein
MQNSLAGYKYSIPRLGILVIIESSGEDAMEIELTVPSISLTIETSTC